ncbi:MAG: N-acetyl-gamma-glutamyl-phosphate reductase [Candidatus Dormibacteria bacterium]
MSKKPVRAAVVGATGYGGVQLIQILEAHPGVELVAAVSSSSAGQSLGDTYPHLLPGPRLVDESALLVDPPEVILSALPHGESAARAGAWLELGAVVIDLGADFRLRDPDLYQVWYGQGHPAPELLDSAVPGFTELHADALRTASLVAVPGCYTTASVLALAPAAATGRLNTKRVVIDAKSGVSGAGRGLSLGTHFSEVNESVSAYALGGHRHLPELEQELGRLNSGREPYLVFVPHLVPMTRGILATCYFAFDGRPDDLRDLYLRYYQDEPFVRVQDRPPATKQASGSNLCYISTAVQSDTAIITSAIDNLVKGAAGQAVECLNLRFGLERTMGLTPPPRWP